VRGAQRQPALVRFGYLMRLVAKLKRFHVKDWIDNFLQESDEKLIVFSGHTKMIDWLGVQYPKNSTRIDGQVTGVKRMHAVDRFQKDPLCRFARCNPKAAGVGLNMTAGSHVLFTDFPFTPGTLKQGEDRAHRIGQIRQCFVWFMAVAGTVEERLMTLLIEKQDVLDEVLDGTGEGRDFDLFRRLLEDER